MKQEEPRFANPTATCYSRAPQRKDEAGRCKEQFEHRSCPGQHVVGVCSHISCEDTQQAIADSFFLNRVKDAAGVEAETAVGRRVQKLVLRPHEIMLGLSTFFFCTGHEPVALLEPGSFCLEHASFCVGSSRRCPCRSLRGEPRPRQVLRVRAVAADELGDLVLRGAVVRGPPGCRDRNSRTARQKQVLHARP